MIHVIVSLHARVSVRRALTFSGRFLVVSCNIHRVHSVAMTKQRKIIVVGRYEQKVPIL